MFDVIVIGGGPAGLSAALILGRARRMVLVCDHGRPRNAAADTMHGYLSRDGVKPLELLRLGRRELASYGVQFQQGEVVEARRRKGHFEVRMHDGARYAGRKLLLATGMRDQLPRINGLTDCYGKSVHHCPYCDGWEWRDRRLAAYGSGKAGLGLALALRNWSDDVVLCTDGERGRLNAHAKVLQQHQIAVHEKKILRLVHERGRLKQVIFDDGTFIKRDALFFNTDQRQKSSLAEKLGCEFDRRGGVVVDKKERTCVPGLYLAGDASRDVQFVITAASEGAIAAVAINREFQEEEGRTLQVGGRTRRVVRARRR